MDLASRLILFIEVAELGSFAKVSDNRNIDRSVVSKQISKLEEELQVRLLNRTTRSISLTAAGADVLRQAASLRQLLSDTERVAQNYHSEPRGVLRITSTTYLGRKYVHPILMEFQQKYPDIEIELRLEDRLVDIVGEGYDIGFRIGIPKDSSLIAQKIARNRLVLVAAPSLLERYGRPHSVQDFEEMPAVIYCAAGYRADKINYFDGGEEQTIQLNSVYRVNEDELMVDAVLQGLGVAAATAYMIQGEIKDGRLVPVLTNVHLAELGPFYAIYPHREPPIKTRLFLDMMKAKIGVKRPVWEANIAGFDTMYGNTD